MLFPGSVAGNTAFDAVNDLLVSVEPWEGEETYTVVSDGASVTVGSVNRYIYLKDPSDFFKVFELPAGTYSPGEFADVIGDVTQRMCTGDSETRMLKIPAKYDTGPLSDAELSQLSPTLEQWPEGTGPTNPQSINNLLGAATQFGEGVTQVAVFFLVAADGSALRRLRVSQLAL